MIRSPSQCPGTARSSASAGRSLMSTMPGICPRRSATPRDRLRPPGPQAARELAAQVAAALHVQALVDGLVAHPHRLVVRELQAQPASDLARRPPLLEPRLDALEERPRCELGRFGGDGLGHAPLVRLHGPVAGAAVRRHLAAYRRGRPADPGRDRDREAARPRRPYDAAGLAAPGAWMTRLTVRSEQPIAAALSRIDRPSRRSLRTSRRRSAVICRAKGSSASGQLIVHRLAACCGDPLKPPPPFTAYYWSSSMTISFRDGSGAITASRWPRSTSPATARNRYSPGTNSGK